MRNDLHLLQDMRADLQQAVQPTATVQTTAKAAGSKAAEA